MARPFFWRRRSTRRFVLQAGFVAALAALVVSAILIARANLATQGMSAGFGFLTKATAWEMNFALLPTQPDDSYAWYLLMGLLNTMFMGVVGLTGATLIGLVVGMVRSGANPAARLLGTIYIETFRNLPLIVQLYFWYALATSLPPPRQALQAGGMILSARGIYLPGLNVGPLAAALTVAVLAAAFAALVSLATARRFRRWEPARRRSLRGAILALSGLAVAVILTLGRLPGDLFSLPVLAGLNIRGGIRIQPEVYSLALAIMLYGGAYIGEIVRGGFKSVGRGPVEAARALGLTPWQVFAHVRLPLAFRAMLPILINQYVWLIKATTLGIAVGFSDFFMVVATSITHSGQTLEFIALLMGGFLAINVSLAAVLNRLNRAIALKGHQSGVAT